MLKQKVTVKAMAVFDGQMFSSFDMDALTQPMAWDAVLEPHMVSSYNQVG